MARVARSNYRLLSLAVALGLLTGSASAQMMPGMSLPTQKEQKQLTPEQKKYQQELDENYKAANKKIPDQQPTDPWAAIRPAPTVSPSKKKQQ
jgi:hypothetical protein